MRKRRSPCSSACPNPTPCRQGARDPLNDAVRRAKDIAAACPNVRVQLLDGGHWCSARPAPAASPCTGGGPGQLTC
jgi:hypothetical protein